MRCYYWVKCQSNSQILFTKKNGPIQVTLYENILVNYVAIEYWISPLHKAIDCVLHMMVGRLYPGVLNFHMSHCFMVHDLM